MTIRRFHPNARMSQAVVANGFVFISGQVAARDSEDINGQTRQVLQQIERLLAEAGSDKNRLVSVTIYLADIEDFASMNAIWESWIATDVRPARATVAARLAGSRYRIEVQATAAL